MDWPLLADLHPDDRRRVLSAATRRRYARGEVVFHEGDPADTLHLLAKGRVAVRASNPMGEVVTLAVLGPGSFFGDQALVLPDSPRTATVASLEPVETLCLRAEQFEVLRREHPTVERFLVVMLADQVRTLSSLLLEAMYLPAEDRVVRRLASLVRVYGASSDDRSGGGGDGRAGEPVVVPLTQQDLATMAGTTRPTANRVLKALEDDGLVQVSRGRITITDVAVLRSRAR